MLENNIGLSEFFCQLNNLCETVLLLYHMMNDENEVLLGVGYIATVSV